MKSNGERRVTQQNIAEKVGVSRATVSMALRGRPGIPEATKQRIQRVADELGYSPDPMLSALSSYRNRQRSPSFHGTLAWLVNSKYRFDWQRSPHFVSYFEGAKEMARTRGFQCEVFDLYTEGMSPKRLASVLKARSISGILLCPQPKPYMEMDFLWEEFSVVTFGHTLEKPDLHTVAAAHYRAMRRVMSELTFRGYQRIGLVIGDEHNARLDSNYTAAYLSFCREGGLEAGVPILPTFFSRRNLKKIRAWIETHEPDVVISVGREMLNLVDEMKIKVPGELGLVNACQVKRSMDPLLSSMVDDPVHIGKVAVDFLVEMMNRGECGVPIYQQRLLVESHWHEGTTLRARPR